MKDRRYFWVLNLNLVFSGLLALTLTVLDIVFPGYFLSIGIFILVVSFIVSRMRSISAIGRFGGFVSDICAADREKRIPPHLPPELLSQAEKLEAHFKDIDSRLGHARAVSRKLDDLSENASRAVSDLFAGDDAQRRTYLEAAALTREADVFIKKIASLLEFLATAAEENSSSILEMTTINSEVSENMTVMGNSVRETVSSITDMAHSTKEVAGNIEALSETAETTSTAVSEMDVSIDQVKSNADETTRISENVSHDAERGAEAVFKTLEAINKIKKSSQVAVEVIFNLGQKIETIGQILNVIDDVAEQTNLLALNAAIIAAQAGEHGRGFAVVADEIKDLAERSAVSTKEIAGLIQTIQTESRNAIAAVEQGNAFVESGVQVSAEAEQALKQILESAKKSSNMMRSIARATEEQARGSKQVTDAITRVAVAVQQIAMATSEQASGADVIAKVAEKMRSIAQHVERSTQEQAKAGRQISESIESMSRIVNQVNELHGTQHQEIDKVMALFVQMDNVSSEHRANLAEVKRIVGSMKDLAKERDRN